MDKRGTGTFVTDEIELTTGCLDVFSKHVRSKDLDYAFEVQYNTVNSITNEGPYEFHIPRDKEHFTALQYTRLSGTVAITKTAGDKNIADGDSFNIINLFAQSLFKQVEVYVEGVCVTDRGTPTYGLRAYLETLLTYDKGAKDTHLTLEGWYQDPDGEEDKNFYSTTDIGKNPAYAKKKDLIKKDFHFNLILHADFFQIQKYLLPDTDIVVKLIRNSDAYSVLAEKPLATIQVKDLKLQIRKIGVNRDLHGSIMSRLSRGDLAEYQMTQSKIRTIILQSGLKMVTLPDLCIDTLPQTLILGFLKFKKISRRYQLHTFQV